ncbi:MAG: hypothetical protein ACRDQH_05620 [Pseudonocardiaceae bacterium]
MRRMTTWPGVYHETHDPEGSGLHDPIFEDLLGDARGQRVLALACGQSRDARLLADLDATVIRVDVSARLLAYAQRFELGAAAWYRVRRGGRTGP